MHMQRKAVQSYDQKIFNAYSDANEYETWYSADEALNKKNEGFNII